MLAGFVAPGESAEEAVIREVHEESSIVVRDSESTSTSQPWPFPVIADARLSRAQPTAAIRSATDGELADVGWYELEDVRATLAGADRGFMLPPAISIARYADRALGRAQRPLTAASGPRSTIAWIRFSERGSVRSSSNGPKRVRNQVAPTAAHGAGSLPTGKSTTNS